MGTAHIPVEILGESFIIEVEYKITYRGCAQTFDSPAEGPEWEIDSFKLYRDWKVDDLTIAVERRNTALETPQWMVDLFNEDAWLDEQVGEYIYANEDDEPDEREYERED